MTIVLAAIADKGNAIVMASDRMLSDIAGTYQFEHESHKVTQIGNYLVGYSGETSFADDIFSHEYNSKADLKGFVKELSEFYIEYGKAISTRVLLEPFGLDLAKLSANPSDYPESLRDRIYDEIRENQLDLDFIICGYDKEKPKIYLVTKYGVYSSAHSIGYASIGIGEAHAENFYMVNRFSFNTPLRQAIFFAFRAKKSTEISSGIGKCTDMCVLEKNKQPVFYKDGCKFISELNRIYSNYQKKQDRLYEHDIVPALGKLDMEGTDEDK